MKIQKHTHLQYTYIYKRTSPHIYPHSDVNVAIIIHFNHTDIFVLKHTQHDTLNTLNIKIFKQFE